VDTSKGPDPAARVCPRCGEEAGKQAFCGGCGLNLSAQHELPTRSKWEKAHIAPAQNAQSSVPMRANDGEHHDTPLPPTKQSGRGFRRWYDEQSKGGKVAFILSTTLAVLLVLGVIAVAASSGGGGSGGTASREPIHRAELEACVRGGSKYETYPEGETDAEGGVGETACKDVKLNMKVGGLEAVQREGEEEEAASGAPSMSELEAKCKGSEPEESVSCEPGTANEP
jgi:hypothetical protein